MGNTTDTILSRCRVRALAAYMCCVATMAFVACGPKGALQSHTVTLTVPQFSPPIVSKVHVPQRTKHAPVPLVVILDDGPPVDNTHSRRQAARIGQLASMIAHRGYAVWRPLENAWPADTIVIRCPDELVAQVRVGLFAVKEAPVIDSAAIVVLGFGQGGVIGTTLARRTGPLVHALGLVGTPARSVDRAVASPSLHDSVALKRLRRIFDEIRVGAYPDTQIVLRGRAECWRSWMALTERITDVVATLPQPVLAVQGTADTFLPMLDIERFRRAIRGRPHSAAHSAVGVRHDLSDAVPDPKQSRGVISPRLAPIVLDWLAEVAPVAQ